MLRITLWPQVVLTKPQTLVVNQKSRTCKKSKNKEMRTKQVTLRNARLAKNKPNFRDKIPGKVYRGRDTFRVCGRAEVPRSTLVPLEGHLKKTK